MENGQLRQSRRHSDAQHDDLQYTASRGNVPALVLEDQIHKAPAPGQKMVSTYPRVYHNQQKLGDAAAKSFDAKEVREETALYEYPITRGIEKSFEFGMKKTSLKQINRKIEPKERKECFERSINDPGVFRGIVDDGKNIIGVVAHPEMDIHIHERAYLEPLNTQGRCCIRSYRNRIALSRSQTWPRR